MTKNLKKLKKEDWNRLFPNVMWKQIIFRDYLNTNKKRAKEYENLKLELAFKFKNDRGSYVLGKTDFVNETINIATKK